MYFLLPKHKSAFWDRTPPHLHINQGVKFLFFPIFLSILLCFLFFFSNFLLFFLFFRHFTHNKEIFVRDLNILSLFKYVVYRVHFFSIKLYLLSLKCLYLF